MDLVVNHAGDSIACKIDSITDTHIYFEMKSNNKWIHTYNDICNITEYKRNAINKDLFKFKPGTSHIESTAIKKSVYSYHNLRNSSPKELSLYLEQAQKQKKNGIILSIVGSTLVISGFTLAYNNFEISSDPDHGADFLLSTGSIMVIGGGMTTVVGLARLSLNSSRINMIEGIKNGSSGNV